MPRKLFPLSATLKTMNRRIAISPRATWRERFVEIARQAETAPSRPAAGGGLRLRAKMAGIAALRRGRSAAQAWS